jgi:hypothetical protein
MEENNIIKLRAKINQKAIIFLYSKIIIMIVFLIISFIFIFSIYQFFFNNGQIKDKNFDA